MISIKIGERDVTQLADVKSLRIKRLNSMRHSLQATFWLPVTEIVRAGGEITVDESGRRLFGGLIQSFNRRQINSDTVELSVNASGYWQILSRRTTQDKYSGPIEAGSIVRHQAQECLIDSTSPYGGESITMGIIQPGITLESYDVDVMNLQDLFEDLALACGYLCWIDDERQLHFRAAPPPSAALFTLDDTRGRPAHIFDGPRLEESLADYRNKTFVVGKKKEDGTPTAGSYSDEAEQQRMGSLYGSGVYGAVVYNHNITSDKSAEEAAKIIQSAYGRQPLQLSFSSLDYFEVNQYLWVDQPALGLQQQTFLIEEVTITWFTGSDPIYTCKASWFPSEHLDAPVHFGRGIQTLAGDALDSPHPITVKESWAKVLGRMGSSGVSGGLVPGLSDPRVIDAPKSNGPYGRQGGRWVEVLAADTPLGIEEAPLDSGRYLRQLGTWVRDSAPLRRLSRLDIYDDYFIIEWSGSGPQRFSYSLDVNGMVESISDGKGYTAHIGNHFS